MASGVASFSSDKLVLKDILTLVSDGKFQLPDFQRSWVWDQDRIRGLIASVTMSYPIGAIMLLEGGNLSIKLKPRILDGVLIDTKTVPDMLILDGQQRITSLYQAMFSKNPVKTKKEQKPKEILKKWFYIDMNKALNENEDREDAVLILNENRINVDFLSNVVIDCSSREKEYQNMCFPCSAIFDSSDWRQGFQDHWDYDKEKIKFFNQFEKEIIKRVEGYSIPTITLKKETPKEAVCQVFERVNTGGVPLNVFELLTAMYASDDFNLRDDWTAKEKRIIKPILNEKAGVLKNIENTDYLQTVALIVSYRKKYKALHDGVPNEQAPAIGCKRKDILGLILDEYRNASEEATKGYEKAAKFLTSQNIFSYRDIPYTKQIVPLAAIFAILGDKADEDGVKKFITRWFWCGILGEKYGSAIEGTFAKDVPEVIDWINGGLEPTTVSSSVFSQKRLITMRTRNSAAYKGLYALLIRNGCLDFLSGNRIDLNIYFDESMDIHHIFPQAWCESNKVRPSIYNSIVNKTAISAKANRTIGGNAPSDYLMRGQERWKISQERMDEILTSHLIDAGKIRKNDFRNFMLDRIEKFSGIIESAMGKPVSREMIDLLGNEALMADEDADIELIN
jgi:hypothetical protein